MDENFHAVVHLFDPMSHSEFASLCDSIKTQGLQQPIVRWKGQIIDGRHRFQACQTLGLTPTFEDLPDSTSDQEVFAKAVALNLYRRHLTLEQRALIASKLANWAVGSNQHTAVAAGSLSQAKAAELLGVSADSLQRASKTQKNGIPELLQELQQGRISLKRACEIATQAPKQQQRILAALNTALRKNDMSRVRQERLHTTTCMAQPMPDKRYHLLYVDPPWDYKNKQETTRVNPALHYPTMTHEQLRALPVADLTHANALLCLWTTSYHLPKALELIKVWGFRYATNWIWVKPSHVVGAGMFNMSHEILLLAKRGQGLGTPAQKFTSWIEAPKARHSTKPDVFRERLEAMFPDASRIELFARSQRKSWDAWGNQIASAQAT